MSSPAILLALGLACGLLAIVDCVLVIVLHAGTVELLLALAAIAAGVACWYTLDVWNRVR